MQKQTQPLLQENREDQNVQNTWCLGKVVRLSQLDLAMGGNHRNFQRPGGGGARL